MVRLDEYELNNYSFKHKFLVSIWTLVRAFFFLTSFPFPNKIKVSILKLFGAKIGEGVVIKPNVNIKFPWRLVVGDHTWIGENVWIDNLENVCISDHCCLSQGSFLLTGNHNYKSRTFDLLTSQINICQGAWIGAKSVVCPGVVIGEHAVLTVGSIAKCDLQPNGIYSGSPAVFVRSRFENDRC
ncbi:WcaF family extracellular polysaccharide biosynthesis acetyltransferase [Vibrio sp. 1978]|uniref:WcaF family extracellular polysaccharide biosynthesis acetyltransferase n=1 Tax=Vibrio sp. 1978 TaxID=3074585 RepID=UPI00296627FB|nr:WcaF family extracellular polysaccharide biosynthesis acetyltransferase [Vibrio sp. 1978]MDW3056450.1 WcaF family extracellular polysaccharide biosynthesis acetyltransferase [Vibrio sp. 1978]